eukprot:g3338.t1
MLCTDEDVLICIDLSVDEINARIHRNIILEFCTVTILYHQVVHRVPGYNVADFGSLVLFPSGSYQIVKQLLKWKRTLQHDAETQGDDTELEGKSGKRQQR